MVLAVDAVMGVGLVVHVLTIPSQGRSGEPSSPCNGGHCASPWAGAPCSRKGFASPDGPLVNLDGPAVNSQLLQLETIPQICWLTAVSCMAESVLRQDLFPVMLTSPVDMLCGTFVRSGTRVSWYLWLYGQSRSPWDRRLSEEQMEAVSERWLWQQGGKDVNQGGGVQGLMFMGYRAMQQQHRPWLSQTGCFGEQTSPKRGFGERYFWACSH